VPAVELRACQSDREALQQAAAWLKEHGSCQTVEVWRDGEVVATTPDLITLLDVDSGATVQTELVRYGLRTAVLGIPADPAWHTPEGIALFGPGRFGYDVPFHPVPVKARSEASGNGSDK